MDETFFTRERIIYGCGSAFVVFVILVTALSVGPIQREAERRANDILRIEGFTWATADASGRGIAILGEAPSAEAGEAAIAAVEDDWAIRAAWSEYTIAPPKPAAPPQAAMSPKPAEPPAAAAPKPMPEPAPPPAEVAVAAPMEKPAPPAVEAPTETQRPRMAAAPINGNAHGADSAPIVASGPVIQKAEECQQALDGLLEGERIQFASSSAKLNPDSHGLLESLGGLLQRCEGASVEVAGHTDASGDAKKNVSLSQARAESVVTFLLTRGVPAERLSAKGYGAAQPIAENETPEGRARNRRIEFRVRSGGDE